MIDRLTIRRPDDFHVHLRQGEMLNLVAPETAKQFARALVMPNTKVPVLTGEYASRYREEIVRAAPGFEPLLSLYLTESTTLADIQAANGAGVVAGKLYPRGTTTQSAHGVLITKIWSLYETFREMEEVDMTLCIHAENPLAFCLEREAAFLPILHRLAEQFPKLRIVVEHVSSAAAVEFVTRLPSNVGATITAHHLLLTLDDVVGGLLQPHHFCKPVAKRFEDRRVLIAAATSGNPKFFFGSDSAPHARDAKECAEGCAGIFTAPVALPLLARIFEDHGALERLEPFVSEFGARFYGLPLNDGTITLRREPWIVPKMIGDIVPFFAGKSLDWSVA